jgi:hypothetical protein
VLVCVTWIVLCAVVPLAWVAMQLRSEMAGLSGSGGVGFVTFGLNPLIVILPPVLFCLAWFVARRRHRRGAAGPAV